MIQILIYTHAFFGGIALLSGSVSIISKKGKILEVVHPDATISGKANIGEGVFIARNVSINLLASLLPAVALLTFCSICFVVSSRIFIVICKG